MTPIIAGTITRVGDGVSGDVILSSSPFARFFFRNEINQGLFLVECPAAAGSDALRDGDELRIDLPAQEVRFADERHRFLAPPNIILEIVEAGGAGGGSERDHPIP